ncbi:F-box protein FBW2 [Canna indica]|uniref:F-box protein FBW2 n=1 Tax=Canna indica TaxID=4628 RepID=A0AAQ3JLI7_9LILI|nr:F-box protein FBW2 [Canna indica]
MAEGSEVRAWGDLTPDALGLIFRSLPLEDILTVIPTVCKSWGRAVSGPYCWQEIDIGEWSEMCKPEQLDQMLHMLIARSCGSFRSLRAYGLSESMFSFMADHAGSLQRLELPRSEISDSIVELVAPRLSNLTYLDLSYCRKIGARAIEAFGKNCRSLTYLVRRIHPTEWAIDNVCQDDEAYAIAKTMPQLRHLQLPYFLLTTQGALEIISKCRDLEHLDLRGCWNVTLDEKYLKEWHSNLHVIGPDIIDCYEHYFWDGCTVYSDSSYSWEFMEHEDDVQEGVNDDELWEDEQGLGSLEFRFYEDWPPSP